MSNPSGPQVELRTRELHAVLVTPFDDQGEVDERALRGLVDFYLHAGARGLVAGSVMGEGGSFTELERERVVGAVVEQAAGRAPVVLGCSGDAAAMGRTAAVAARRGAVGVLVGPPATAPLDGAFLQAWLRPITDAADLSVVLLDYPPLTGQMTVDAIAEACERVPALEGLKVEQVPTSTKIAGLRARLGARLRLWGARGGLYVPQELLAGSDGLMTGVAYPEALVAILEAFSAADVAGAFRLHAAALPWLVLEAQPGIAVAMRKAILAHRGLLENARVRPPLEPLDRGALEELGAVARRL
jgi:4-hydroxy-tetrahydrodipicolinate synthase